MKNRAIGTHNMNEHSSRSHTILTVHIHSEEKATSEDNKGVFITRHGKMNFVDLAGSEMTKKTRSEGKTLEEANNINKSLMVLGYCIAQLSSQKRHTEKGVHIPYRDSKLTKLLADSLAGNGVTLMVRKRGPFQWSFSNPTFTDCLRLSGRLEPLRIDEHAALCGACQEDQDEARRGHGELAAHIPKAFLLACAYMGRVLAVYLTSLHSSVNARLLVLYA